jgi:hypothetical protein
MIYSDNLKVDQTAEINLVANLLAYMETPQYLRKRLFKLKPELQYVGILPPLRTPHHPLNHRMKNLKVDEYREGVTVSGAKEGTLVDIGVEQPALILNKQLPMGNRVTVKIVMTGKRVEVELENHDEIPAYWGYNIIVKRESLAKILERREFDLTVATSRYGNPLVDLAEEMAHKWKKAQRILLAFGAPSQGLFKIFENQGSNLDESFDFVVNTIPQQGTETVRTEEALIASLAIFNIRFNL